MARSSGMQAVEASAGQAGAAASRGHVTGQHGCKTKTFSIPWCIGVPLQHPSLWLPSVACLRGPDRRTENLVKPADLHALSHTVDRRPLQSPPSPKEWGADSFQTLLDRRVPLLLQ